MEKYELKKSGYEFRPAGSVNKKYKEKFIKDTTKKVIKSIHTKK